MIAEKDEDSGQLTWDMGLGHKPPMEMDMGTTIVPPNIKCNGVKLPYVTSYFLEYGN